MKKTVFTVKVKGILFAFFLTVICAVLFCVFIHNTTSAVSTTSRIPILMFHSINHDPHNPNDMYRVPRNKFDAEMKWLYNHKYRTLSLDEVYYNITHKIRFSARSVVITFDDGYGDNYYDASPIMKKYNFKGTVFVITGDIDNIKNGYLSGQQLKELDRDGMDIEVHTVTHRYLSALPYTIQYHELHDSKKTLQYLLRKKCYYIAFPYGAYNSTTIAIAKKLGYRLCFISYGGMALPSSSKYSFPRIFVGQDLKSFITSVQS